MENEEKEKAYTYLVAWWQDGSGDPTDRISARQVRGDITITSNLNIHKKAEAEAVYAQAKATVEALGWRVDALQISALYIKVYHEEA